MLQNIRIALRAVCLVGFGFVLAMSVRAQIPYYDMPPSYWQMSSFIYASGENMRIINEGLLKSAKSGSNGRTSSADDLTRIKAAPLSSLNFTSSAATRGQVTDRVARAMGKNDPGLTKRLKAAFKRDNLVGKFNRIGADYGFANNNVADAYVLFVVLSWEAVRGKDASGYKKGIDAYRNDIQYTMLRNQKLTGLSNNEKQISAETMAMLGMMAKTSVDGLSNGDDLDQIRDGIRKVTLKIAGVDVSKFDLTKSGYRTR